MSKYVFDRQSRALTLLAAKLLKQFLKTSDRFDARLDKILLTSRFMPVKKTEMKSGKWHETLSGINVRERMEQIQAVIFDMDGVIVNSEPLHLEAERTILQHHGIEAPWDQWDMFTGVSDVKIFQYVVEHFSDGRYSAEQLLAAKYPIFLKLLAEKLEPIPGAIEFIHWCRPRFPKLALTTSSIKRVQELVFQRFALTPFFDVVVTEEGIQHCKPHPEPYLKTIDALQVAARHCLVLEDSLNGIKSAKDAGCYVAGITTTFSAEQLHEAGADVVFDHFETLYHQAPFNNHARA